VVDYIDGFRASVADMPGIIDGASQGKGLGFEFLRHIQRTKGLVYVLDVTDNPEKTLLTLYKELRLYDEKLVQKPYAIALNKADLMQDTKEIEKRFDGKAIVISAKFGKGLEKVATQIKEIVKMFEVSKDY
jgi:GTPase